ncbi:hypothetical protein P389DRAFT_196622 [Cystobasidium minutum MCA 4210]|uniref:uncharacterized protein n=1 Tax=Cystobasidium minutum MCA 4210 TaxID=1397322 RepID=UPI0034CFBE7C|eukprot:jgi/Rhomi1/196622/gm1.4836_g
MPPAASSADPWDDWESEDYGRGVNPPSDEASANARLWQVANNSLSFGPSPVLSGHQGSNQNPYAYGSSSSTSSPAPAAAFVPSLKILKRPSNASAANAAANQAARDQQKKTLKDRERAYNEARNRIFGSSSSSTPNSAPQSGASSPVGKATSPTASTSQTPAEVTDLSASIDSLDLEGKKRAGSNTSRSGTPALGSSNRNSNPGKPRISRGAGAASPSQSTPNSSRPSTPSSTIIREPVNPPSSAEKNSSAKVHLQARGFSSTRKAKSLSPSAAAFVPGSFKASSTPKPANQEASGSEQQ